MRWNICWPARPPFRLARPVSSTRARRLRSSTASTTFWPLNALEASRRSSGQLSRRASECRRGCFRARAPPSDPGRPPMPSVASPRGGRVRPMGPRTRLVGLLVRALLLSILAGCAPLAARLPVAESAVTRTSAGEPAPALQQVTGGQSALSVQQQPADVPPGRILYVRDGNLWLWQSGTSRQFSDGGTWYQPSFSPDGTEIAYVYWTFNFSDIFVMAADGASARRLTKGQAASIMDSDWAFRPKWSPDGSQLAYVSDGNSQFP